MRIKNRWLLGIGVTLLWITATSSVAMGQAAHVRWDIVSVATGSPLPGGVASARAQNCSKITLTGSGTFVAPAGGGGTSSGVTGGGTWETFSATAPCTCSSTATGTSTGSGTYEVTGLVRWEEKGTFPALSDTAVGGLATLRVVFSDGSHGVLVVSCHSPSGSDPAIFEGITVSKSFVDYWNREAPSGAPFVDANRTLFHIE